ncbi:MAG: CsgG/HfaB family protein [Treponema sp.]|nr:CsgG/HfaB family protein [Treponema sp.]
MERFKSILACIILFLMTEGVLLSQEYTTFDQAIKTAVTEIENKLVRGVKVVVLNFKSESTRFSDFVLDEIMTELVSNGKTVVVDRANLSLIQQEMHFQMSGEVNDSSAQAIGQKLGAQSIISGSIEDLGNYYRMRFRTIEVETAAIQVLTSINVRKDRTINTLMTPPAGAAPQAAAPAPAGSHNSIIDTGSKPVRKIPASRGNFEVIQGTRLRIPIDMDKFYKAAVESLNVLSYSIDATGTGFILFTIKGGNWWCQIKLCYWTDEYWLEYINSHNLGADPARNKIHNNYLGWIERVQRQIGSRYR